MAHRVMPLPSQSVIGSIPQITWKPDQAATKKIPGTKCYHLMEKPKP